MFLFFLTCHPQNIIILYLFSMKHSDLLMAKITSNNSLELGAMGIWNISILLSPLYGTKYSRIDQVNFVEEVFEV